MSVINQLGWFLSFVLLVFGGAGIWSGIHNLTQGTTNSADVAVRLILGATLIVLGVLALRSNLRIQKRS